MKVRTVITVEDDTLTAKQKYRLEETIGGMIVEMLSEFCNVSEAGLIYDHEPRVAHVPKGAEVNEDE